MIQAYEISLQLSRKNKNQRVMPLRMIGEGRQRGGDQQILGYWPPVNISRIR
jgi:hypothetical protein